MINYFLVFCILILIYIVWDNGKMFEKSYTLNKEHNGELNEIIDELQMELGTYRSKNFIEFWAFEDAPSEYRKLFKKKLGHIEDLNSLLCVHPQYRRYFDSLGYGYDGYFTVEKKDKTLLIAGK